jgi:hypothetical protein
MRKVNVFSTSANEVKSVMSNATTWGALKAELGSQVNDNMKVTVRETRNDLVDDNAILPEGEFTIFLFPAKIKSGYGC